MATLVQKLGVFGDWSYFKVKATGDSTSTGTYMTSAHIKSICEINGLTNTCVGPSSCSYATTNKCTVTALTGCETPMKHLSESLCGETVLSNYIEHCKMLYDVYAYMANYNGYSQGYDSTKGKMVASFNIESDSTWALCAKRHDGKISSCLLILLSLLSNFIEKTFFRDS